ncbi:hypothetical protein J2Y41_003900 [Arthrobacter sp. 1088]|nr:hypothetical protein [Arthrobacter sp. 1088]
MMPFPPTISTVCEAFPLTTPTRPKETTLRLSPPPETANSISSCRREKPTSGTRMPPSSAPPPDAALDYNRTNPLRGQIISESLNITGAGEIHHWSHESTPCSAQPEPVVTPSATPTPKATTTPTAAPTADSTGPQPTEPVAPTSYPTETTPGKSSRTQHKPSLLRPALTVSGLSLPLSLIPIGGLPYC